MKIILKNNNFNRKLYKIVIFLYYRKNCNNFLDAEEGSDGDSSVKMKIKLKQKKTDGRVGRRKKSTKKYISDDDDDGDDN